MTNPVEPTQADREAVLLWRSGWAGCIGEFIELERAFARHRIEACAEKDAEIKRLREALADISNGMTASVFIANNHADEGPQSTWIKRMTLADMTAATNEDPEPEPINFSSPEDVLIEVIRDDIRNTSGDWAGFMIADCTILNGADGVMGAASYEQAYGSFLDYTIEGMIDCPKQEGFYVVEGITGCYFKGDSWSTDDDMKFYYKSVRPSTDEERGMM